MPQGSKLGFLLFFIHTSDLHVAIKYFEVQNFADDSNLLNLQSCETSISIYIRINYDLKT